MELKPGDQVWSGPYTVAGNLGDAPILQGSSKDAKTMIPHHEALPAIAAWLDEWRGMPEVLESMFNTLAETPEWKYSPGDGLRGLRALVKALTPEAGDAGARS